MTTKASATLAPYGKPSPLCSAHASDARALAAIGIPHRWTIDGVAVSADELRATLADHTARRTPSNLRPRVQLAVASYVHAPGAVVYAKRDGEILHGVTRDGSKTFFGRGERFEVASLRWREVARTGVFRYLLQRPGNREDVIGEPSRAEVHIRCIEADSAAEVA